MATTTLPIDQPVLRRRAHATGHVDSRSRDRASARTGTEGSTPVIGETNRPGAEEVADSLMNAVSGFGLASMTYLGLIPGLIPAVALVALLAAIALIPLLAVGVIAAPFLLLARLLGRRD
jgi:hypothetical protein